MEMHAGMGYGPVTLEFEGVESVTEITGEWLRTRGTAEAPICPVFAYAPNAGHEVDEYNAHRVTELLGEHTETFTEHNPFTPLRMIGVDVFEADQATLDRAAEFIRELIEWGPLPDTAEFQAFELDVLNTRVHEALADYGLPVTDENAQKVMHYLLENDPPYFDSGGMVITGMDEAISLISDSEITEGE